MRLALFAALLTLSTAAQALTLDAGQFSGTLVESKLVAGCNDEDCNTYAKSISKTALAENNRSVKTATTTVLQATSTAGTIWVGDATIYDVNSVELAVNLKDLPQQINPGAMAQGLLTVVTRDGNNMGVNEKAYKVSCTVISSKNLSCKTDTFLVKSVAHFLTVSLQAK